MGLRQRNLFRRRSQARYDLHHDGADPERAHTHHADLQEARLQRLPERLTFDVTRDMITLINVFTVEAANQQRLVGLLTRATDEFVRQAPGFVSSVLHRSFDGTKVTMVARWRSEEDYEAM